MELRVGRLALWQRAVAALELHSQLIAAVFGAFAGELRVQALGGAGRRAALAPIRKFISCTHVEAAAER